MKSSYRIWLLFFIVLGLIGCKAPQNLISSSQDIEIILPDWNEEAEKLITPLPPLSRWKITVLSREENKSFYTIESHFTLHSPINEPAAILALPVTVAGASSECTFFKPAGAVYPYFNYNSSTNRLECTWEQGFAAFLFMTLVNNVDSSYCTGEELWYFVKSFNWEKFCQTLQNKTLTEDTFYNPWFLSTKKLCEEIVSGSFSAAKMNNSGCFTLPFTREVLSSYIPENLYYEKTGNLYLNGCGQNYYSFSENYSLVLEGASAKKISEQVIFMPIFIEE